MAAVSQRPERQGAPVSDLRLLSRIAKGDAAAMRELTDRLEATLYAIAYGILFDQEAAEQVVRSVMRRAWREAHYLARAVVPIRRWLARTTRQLATERASEDAEA
jgi:RNA polymerase sigma-70 factor, ECF subfamily